MIRDNIVSPEKPQMVSQQRETRVPEPATLVDAINEFRFKKEEEGVHSSSP